VAVIIAVFIFLKGKTLPLIPLLKNNGCHFYIAYVIKPAANQFEALAAQIKDRPH